MDDKAEDNVSTISDPIIFGRRYQNLVSCAKTKILIMMQNNTDIYMENRNEVKSKFPQNVLKTLTYVWWLCL